MKEVPVPETPSPHKTEAQLRAFLEQGIMEAARQASLEISQEGQPQVQSWLQDQEIGEPDVGMPSGFQCSHSLYCPPECSCRVSNSEELLQLKKDLADLQDWTEAVKNLLKDHMRSAGSAIATSTGSAADSLADGTEVFSIARSADSRATDAKITRQKLKERAVASRSETLSQRARVKEQNAKRTASRTAPGLNDQGIGQALLAQALLGAGSGTPDVQVSAITSGLGLEDMLNPTALRLRQVAEHPKHNGNPPRWPEFQREFKLWCTTQKLHADQFCRRFRNVSKVQPETRGVAPGLIGMLLPSP